MHIPFPTQNLFYNLKLKHLEKFHRIRRKVCIERRRAFYYCCVAVGLMKIFLFFHFNLSPPFFCYVHVYRVEEFSLLYTLEFSEHNRSIFFQINTHKFCCKSCALPGFNHCMELYLIILLLYDSRGKICIYFNCIFKNKLYQF